MKDSPKLLQILKSECPDIWIRLPRHKWPKSWSTIEDPVVPLERGEGFQLGMSLRTPSKGLFLSVYVDDIKSTGKKQNINPMWKLLNKEVDLGEPTSFLHHVYSMVSEQTCTINQKME